MQNLTDSIKDRYAEAARRVTAGGDATCGCACCDPISSNLYDEAEAAIVPDSALRASLGCGNPTALAALRPGETVLDLGSGGGLDLILSARRVGRDGKAYGLDMTDEMLALARENARIAGITNVEFLKGRIEQVPLPNAAVDVVLSNCVINLAADKDVVLREAFRVLKPGGRFAVSDVVVRGELPPEARQSVALWVGCVAGALTEEEYRRKLHAAGFSEIAVETARIYEVEGVPSAVTSAFVRAKKPATPTSPDCCDSSCCRD